MELYFTNGTYTLIFRNSKEKKLLRARFWWWVQLLLFYLARVTTTFEIVIHIQESFYLGFRFLVRRSVSGSRDSQEGQAVLIHSIYQFISTDVSNKEGYNKGKGVGDKKNNLVKKYIYVLCNAYAGHSYGWNQYFYQNYIDFVAKIRFWTRGSCSDCDPLRRHKRRAEQKRQA